MIVELSENFKETLQAEKRPYLLEIYTPSCGVCKQVMPFVKQVETEYGNTYAFYKLNAEKLPGVAQEYDVNAVPTLLFIKNGAIKTRHTGYITKEDIVKKLLEAFEQKNE